MESQRLRYHPLDTTHLDQFHSLIKDDHIRQYLFDGQVFSRAWAAERIRKSLLLFQRRGVGIWMALDKSTSEQVGFCGFLEIPEVHSEPQLVYAVLEGFTGKGYATEMARTAIAEACTKRGFTTILATVDEVNVPSLRILEKLGFMTISNLPGAFGNMRLLQLSCRD
jgi:ribosomal-protein-alanine N-acetyltransferase